MAKFAPVIPLAIANAMKEMGILGKYHLLLAHDVLAFPKEYEFVYGDLVDDKDATIIMDNSLVELGQAMKFKDLAEACKIIEPKYLVAPDVLKDRAETINATFQFLAQLPKSWDIPIMGVVQGIDIADFRECAAWMWSKPAIQALAVPRVCVSQFGSRRWAIKHVVNIAQNAPFGNRKSRAVPLHLLGFSDDILDDVACARMPEVMGIDSAVPIRLALKYKNMSLDHPPETGPRGDFWNQGPGGETAKSYISGNMAKIRKWVDI